MQEKRKAVRIAKSLMVKYSPDGGASGWDVSFIKNISEDGVLFDTGREFPAGSQVSLMFKVPSDLQNWIEAKAEVVASEPFIGKIFLTRFKFIEIGETQKKSVKRYIERIIDPSGARNGDTPENDRRKAARVNKKLMICYGRLDSRGEVEKWDMTSTQNFSKTGMIFTSAYPCQGTVEFMVKIPSRPFESLRIRGKVIESKELKIADSRAAAGTFLTRVEFIELKEEYDKLLGDYVEWLARNETGNSKKEGA
ncbi:MAG: PilZ domain-containing protein [Candidatus Omnitrophica bacterium]|nr:PilZ domain-containing protein [Candidatus Omnitrophota bacterium]MDD5501309.1 PilZ domain-containing protein [Candidatus Omnitrophota bacterium]